MLTSLGFSSKNRLTGLFAQWLELSLGEQSTYQTVVLPKIRSMRPSIRLLAGTTVFISILFLGILIQRQFSTPYDFLPLVVVVSMLSGITLAWLCLAWEMIKSVRHSTTSQREEKL